MSSDEGGNSGISGLEQMLKQVTVTRFNLKNPATMEDLLDEILSKIFIRLFARQLAQMRSVSKSLNALLSHPYFVKKHLQRSIRNNNNEQILLLFPILDQRFTQYSCQSPHLEPTDFIKHPPTNLPRSIVIGSVNGLIGLLSVSDYFNIHIWNPSLSAVSTIPPLHSLISGYLNYIRFGFDPKTEDYKFVKISGIRNNDDDDDNVSVKEWLKVEVYSMRKGCWEFIDQTFPSHITKIRNINYPCVDGHHGYVHWENRAGEWGEDTILGFDLGLETFREIPLPESILDGVHHLGVLDGKLCEISRREDDGWEVWVMEEYGVPDSWTKRHVFSKSKGDWALPYGFTLRNELLAEDEDGHVVLYNPIADKTKSTCAEEKFIQIVEYVDNLV